jgi:hypothetical protein
VPILLNGMAHYQPRTQGFLLPRLDGQRKRPCLRLVCLATLLVNDFECNYSIYVEIIIIFVERKWSDKFIISSGRIEILSK